MKFSIRDVLWLTAVVAMAAGWFADHWRQANQLEAEATARIQSWEVEQLKEVVKASTGGVTTVTKDGIVIKYPDNSAHMFPNPLRNPAKSIP